MINQTFICSWSGGKDSCFAFMEAVQQGRRPVALLNMMNENGQISRSHALPGYLLQQQAAALGLPITSIASTWQDYEQHFTGALTTLAQQYQADSAVFGDIDLVPHREWEEKVCAAAGIEAVLPLWQEDRKALVYRMLQAGIRCMIVSCNAHLGESFLGRILDDVLIADLEAKEVDVCGENGEFHTLVVDCPLFRTPLALPAYQKVEHGGYWFLQWLL